MTVNADKLREILRKVERNRKAADNAHAKAEAADVTLQVSLDELAAAAAAFKNGDVVGDPEPEDEAEAV